MDRRVGRIGLFMGIGVLLGWIPGGARAQFPTVGSGAGSGGVASSAFATPTAAPFMNSMAAMAMSQSTVDPGTSALYFMATSQPGSMMSMGRINPNRQTGVPPQGAARPLNDPARGSANVP